MKCNAVLLIALAVLTAGCATSGISGTTTLTTKYDSNVQADGAEHTVYEQTAKGKAGDVLQAVSQASLVTEDGTGAKRSMAVGATQNNDATRRADSIDAMNQVWSQTVQQINASWMALLSVVAPEAAKLVGQHIETQGANEAARIAGKTANTGKLIDAAPGIIKAATPKPPAVVEPTPEPEPAPVVEQPSPVTDGSPVIVTE